MTEEFSYTVDIPKDRIGAVIGKEGETKEEIESQTDTQLDIDSENGVINIISDSGLNLYEAKEIIQSIGRGFNPGVSFNLLKTDVGLDIINIKDFSGDKKTLKGRVIGEDGRARKELERLTNTDISIYQNTVSIIGRSQNLADARKGIIKLLQGSSHSNVYKFLEDRKVERKKRRENKNL